VLTSAPMVGSLVFTLLVATGDGESPATQAILRALEESLGLGVTAAARELEGPLRDEATLRRSSPVQVRGSHMGLPFVAFTASVNLP
jgi:hypothetical protein